MALTREERNRRHRERYDRLKSEAPEQYAAVKLRKRVVSHRYNEDISADPIKRAANAERMKRYRAFRSAQKLSTPPVQEGRAEVRDGEQQQQREQ
jgi:hypothetical protein